MGRRGWAAQRDGPWRTGLMSGQVHTATGVRVYPFPSLTFTLPSGQVSLCPSTEGQPTCPSNEGIARLQEGASGLQGGSRACFHRKLNSSEHLSLKRCPFPMPQQLVIGVVAVLTPKICLAGRVKHTTHMALCVSLPKRGHWVVWVGHKLEDEPGINVSSQLDLWCALSYCPTSQDFWEGSMPLSQSLLQYLSWNQAMWNILSPSSLAAVCFLILSRVGMVPWATNALWEPYF